MNALLRLLEYIVHCLTACDGIPREKKIILNQLLAAINLNQDYRFVSICTGVKRCNKRSAVSKARFAKKREEYPVKIIYPDGNWEIVVGKTAIEEMTGKTFWQIKDVLKPCKVKAGKNKYFIKHAGEFWHFERP